MKPIITYTTAAGTILALDLSKYKSFACICVRSISRERHCNYAGYFDDSYQKASRWSTGLERFEEALEAFRQAVTCEPNVAMTLSNLGQLLLDH